MAIAASPLIAPYDNPCTGKICFNMGTDMDGGQVKLTNNETGETASRIVFNKGDGRPDVNGVPTMAQLSGLAQFAGTYTGSYSGSITILDKCFPGGDVIPVSGKVTLSVSNGGIITVSVPSAGTGKVSATGAAATGAVQSEYGPVYFSAAIRNNRDNSQSSMSGSWYGKNSCGFGTGGWSASR